MMKVTRFDEVKRGKWQVYYVDTTTGAEYMQRFDDYFFDANDNFVFEHDELISFDHKVDQWGAVMGCIIQL